MGINKEIDALLVNPKRTTYQQFIDSALKEL